MIHEVLQSDVDIAREQLGSDRPDAEILAGLASRGIEPAKANQLLDDLRHGRKPVVQIPILPPLPGEGEVKSRGVAWEGAAHGSRSRSGRHHRARTPWWFIILAGITLLALGYVWMESGRNASSEVINQNKHELPPAPGK